MSAPSGEQFEIAHGEQRATVVEVGGGIREYTDGGRPVLEAYAREAMCDGAHGAPLIPWPNRLTDGRYSFDGEEHQLALSEPTRGNAIHGLLRWRPWRALEREASRVVMGARLLPMTGYPFALELRIAYELGGNGLAVRTTARNIGDRPCPYGAGQHPYLSPGSGAIDECLLELPAGRRLLADPERQLPTGSELVEGTPFDFRGARRVGEQRLDLAFTDLQRDERGCASTRLAGADGRSVELWVDERYTYLEVFTGDTLSPARRRTGLAVEPMSCPPDAFRSGEGILRLEPGSSTSSEWGVRLL